MTDEKVSPGSRYKVPNLDRALTILEFMVKHPEGASLQELTDAMGFSKNSVFRISMTLLERGYLSREEDTKRFFITRKMLAMGTVALSEQHIITTSIDIMRKLRDEVGETVLIGTTVGYEGVVMEQVLGTHTFKFAIDLGHHFPLHASAPGKAMLAYMSPMEQDNYIKHMPMQRFNENTVTDPEHLKKLLAEAKQRGYAFDLGEELVGIKCIGAPVFDRNGFPVAAVWITGPDSRISSDCLDQIGKTIKKYASMISERLGYKIFE